MYAIPWFVTYMANKFAQIELLLEFWETIVARNDPKFIFFFLVSLIIKHQREIMHSEIAKLPEVMTSVKIDSAKDLETLFVQADQLQECTPKSFKHMPELSAILTKNHPGLKIVAQRLEQTPCLPLQPAEVLFYAYHGEIECADPSCCRSIEQHQQPKPILGGKK